MTDWTRIKALNGGGGLYHVEPPLDSEREVWFYDEDALLRVWSEGVLFTKDSRGEPGPARVSARFTLYRVRDQLFVDVEVRGPQAVVRRGVLNGRSVESLAAASEVESLLARYRALRFSEGTPWNATKTQVTVREYRDASSQAWTVRVDGTAVIESGREPVSRPSREAALVLAEERIEAQEREGFRTCLVELMPARFPNPDPKPVKGTPPRKPPAKKAPQAKPHTAHEAVDAAVALLKDLHTRLPRGHFVTECLELETERARVASVERHPDFFLDMHAGRVGRWRAAEPRAPKANESSWDYFVRVYGTLTWILDGQADAGLAMFSCGNVTGGGWSCLELPEAGDYDIAAQAEATGNAALNQLHVFHGGWHTGRSWAFDQRVKSPTGEFAIIAFDDTLESLPRQTKPERIVSFGQASPAEFWYDQPQGEWVVVLAGRACLRFESEPSARTLAPGDHVNIPPHCRHRRRLDQRGAAHHGEGPRGRPHAQAAVLLVIRHDCNIAMLSPSKRDIPWLSHCSSSSISSASR